MRPLAAIGILLSALCDPLPGADPAFAVASLKASAREVGPDYRGSLLAGPDRITGRNVTLLQLISEAYGVERFRISGPPWLDVREFDIDARADAPAPRDRLRLMLRTLLAERFHLSLRTERKEASVFALVVRRGGPKIRPSAEASPAPSGPPARRSFHGELREFAGLLSVQLSIPSVADPTRPAVAAGGPVPVLDQTGLAGVYDFSVDSRPDGSDMLTLWQRILREQLGLELVRRKVEAEFYVVDRADAAPVAN